ncbi:hypothetical protein WMY93_014118 [Mugilogobius chulae]|uniref:Uncharacterized protein n=1 Tax=Mugilogobius chulae TaxID=88201 RepID=A0AAW0NUP2_9GOBI
MGNLIQSDCLSCSRSVVDSSCTRTFSLTLRTSFVHTLDLLPPQRVNSLQEQFQTLLQDSPHTCLELQNVNRTSSSDWTPLSPWRLLRFILGSTGTRHCPTHGAPTRARLHPRHRHLQPQQQDRELPLTAHTYSPHRPGKNTSFSTPAFSPRNTQEEEQGERRVWLNFPPVYRLRCAGTALAFLRCLLRSSAVSRAAN